MEVYFSGTIDRIIFENASNFFKILLLDFNLTGFGIFLYNRTIFI